MPASETANDYVARIDRVLDHVRANLDGKHALDDLARVACFSPFHFHRVFQAMTGETLRAFVARARVERAALLLGRAGTRRSMTELALDCGYSSSAELSRAFRARFGTTPTAYRADATNRKNPQEDLDRDPYRPEGHDRTNEATPLPRVVVVPPIRVAYVRVADPFRPGRLSRALDTLAKFLASHGIDADAIVGISHDDPEVTPAAQCRYDLAHVVPDAVSGQAPVSVRLLPKSTYLELDADGDFESVASAWDRLFRDHLPTSGFEPADGPGLERYRDAPDFEGGSRFRVVLALPVVRVRR